MEEFDVSGTGADRVNTLSYGNPKDRTEELAKKASQFTLLNFYFGWNF